MANLRYPAYHRQYMAAQIWSWSAIIYLPNGYKKWLTIVNPFIDPLIAAMERMAIRVMDKSSTRSTRVYFMAVMAVLNCQKARNQYKKGHL